MFKIIDVALYSWKIGWDVFTCGAGWLISQLFICVPIPYKVQTPTGDLLLQERMPLHAFPYSRQ
jgi:hypothetical protein